MTDNRIEVFLKDFKEQVKARTDAEQAISVLVNADANIVASTLLYLIREVHTFSGAAEYLGFYKHPDWTNEQYAIWEQLEHLEGAIRIHVSPRGATEQLYCIKNSLLEQLHKHPEDNSWIGRILHHSFMTFTNLPETLDSPMPKMDIGKEFLNLNQQT